MTVTHPTLLFAHGWAFDSSIWDAVRTRLADWPQVMFDANYFGTAPDSATLTGPVVAIGHSHGVMRLLAQLPPQCSAVVSINGFSRFSAGPDFPAGTPTKLLDRMITRFQQDPLAVLNTFRERCGADATEPAMLSGALGADLLALRQDDQRASLQNVSVPLLALASTDDPIVTPALTHAVFDGHEHTDLRWHEGGGHLLPLSAPDWCADRIRELLKRLPCAT
jgi:pimeloyl-[acyl-carrier protein] methyl ester esterase